jgi:hypothetical protein
MIEFLIYLLSLAGFFALCLSLPKHQQEVLKRALPRRSVLVLRGSGYGVIALAFVSAIVSRGFGPGLMVFAGLLTVAAATVVGGLAWRASRAKPAARKAAR